MTLVRRFRRYKESQSPLAEWQSPRHQRVPDTRGIARDRQRASSLQIPCDWDSSPRHLRQTGCGYHRWTCRMCWIPGGIRSTTLLRWAGEGIGRSMTGCSSRRCSRLLCLHSDNNHGGSSILKRNEEWRTYREHWMSQIIAIKIRLVGTGASCAVDISDCERVKNENLYINK